MGVHAEKDRLRRVALARRNALDASVRAAKSAKICNALVREVLGAGAHVNGTQSTLPTVAVYAAFGSEVDPAPFALAAEHAGWRVAYPCMLPRDEGAACGQRMRMRAVSQRDRACAPFLTHPTRTYAEQDIDTQRFPAVPASELDAIIVPLVAFDASGNRLGYGGGCYDRYLPTLRSNCPVIGIAFAEQRVEHVPVARHDRPLPLIISV